MTADTASTATVPFRCPECGEHSEAKLVQGVLFASVSEPVVRCGTEWCGAEWRVGLYEVGATALEVWRS